MDRAKKPKGMSTQKKIQQAWAVAREAANTANLVSMGVEQLTKRLTNAERAIRQLVAGHAVLSKIVFRDLGISKEEVHDVFRDLNALSDFVHISRVAATGKPGTEVTLLDIAKNLQRIPLLQKDDNPLLKEETVLIVILATPSAVQEASAEELSHIQGFTIYYYPDKPADLFDVVKVPEHNRACIVFMEGDCLGHLVLDPTSVTDTEFAEGQISLDGREYLDLLLDAFDLPGLVAIKQKEQELPGPPEEKPATPPEEEGKEEEQSGPMEMSPEQFASSGHPKNAIIFGGD